MLYSSPLRTSASQPRFETLQEESLLSASLSPTLIRFVGHLPYFKVGSALMLPQALSLSGVVITTLAYALLCLAASRLFGNRRTPLPGTLALVAAMMVVGPAIATLLPGTTTQAMELSGETTSISSMLIAYLGLLLPVAGGFLAVQWLTRPAARTSN